MRWSHWSSSSYEVWFISRPSLFLACRFWGSQMKSKGIYQVYSILVGFKLQFSPPQSPALWNYWKPPNFSVCQALILKLAVNPLEGKNCPKCQIMTPGFPSHLNLGPPNSYPLGSFRCSNTFLKSIWFSFSVKGWDLNRLDSCFWMQYSISHFENLPRWF